MSKLPLQQRLITKVKLNKTFEVGSAIKVNVLTFEAKPVRLHVPELNRHNNTCLMIIQVNNHLTRLPQRHIPPLRPFYENAFQGNIQHLGGPDGLQTVKLAGRIEFDPVKPAFFGSFGGQVATPVYRSCLPILFYLTIDRTEGCIQRSFGVVDC
tara:strand:- start:287 stop:748 length:462 start_codon:yes stop_codon:yes gene_type:complete